VDRGCRCVESRPTTMPRRFPPPWIAEETDACFIVRDANGQALAYVYFEYEPGRRAATRLMPRDEARRIAANIAKLLTRPRLNTGFRWFQAAHERIFKAMDPDKDGTVSQEEMLDFMRGPDKSAPQH
jgi:hypothetical protein